MLQKGVTQLCCVVPKNGVTWEGRKGDRKEREKFTNFGRGLERQILPIKQKTVLFKYAR